MNLTYHGSFLKSVHLRRYIIVQEKKILFHILNVQYLQTKQLAI